MQLGMIGLGRMGGNMVRRLMRNGHKCVVFDLSPANVQSLVTEGATGSDSMESFVKALSKPRVAWVMVPAGHATDVTITKLASLMEPGDIVIDGGNSYFQAMSAIPSSSRKKASSFVDVGTSGGVWGIDRGYCMMVGGVQRRPSTQHRSHPLKTLAPGMGDVGTHPGRGNKGTSRTREKAILHTGPDRRRPLREDGAQRHRIRPDAGLCRGLRHLFQACQLERN